MALQAALRNAQSKTPSLRTVARSKTPAQGALRTVHTKTTKTMTSLRTVTTKRLAAARVARSKTTMRVVGSRSSAEDPDALAARLAAQLAPEVAPTRSMAAVVVASPCSVATVTQHLVDELQLDAAVGFGSHREAFCEACDGANPRAAVTLLAMPDGATATAFASDAGCLPALEDWERFVQAPPSLLLFAAAGSPSERNKLDDWLRRVDGVLPESPKVGGVVNDDGPVVAGGRGRALEEGAVAGLALDGGVDSLVGLHVVVAPGSTPLSEDHSLVTASLPMPRGDRVLVTGVDGRRVRKSALGLDEDGRDTILAELMTGSEGRTCPVEVEHGSLAVCCCPQTIVPGETRLRLRAVGDRDARERAVLASVAPARRAHGDSAILEFSGVSCAPGEPSLVAEALGANALGATFRAAIAPGPTSCRTVVHDQATVLAYVAPGV
ncbi:unnamed protein product [Pelagomonas calceolata]|uniref:FIST domain-containing protein n=2 Tax=Pelagomonas calceolata TaxID=35677 RepID=A0A7S4E5R9_9STRA|nr:unnamed protein product [Pelagomonas calceolata]|mmetsp:Transcript_17165/g.48967  ORF Transcript_17165/g.48967 Transcript_17165/m.48967 type:complete len:439 (+) Transcript_17165:128-1444(+)